MKFENKIKISVALIISCVTTYVVYTHELNYAWVDIPAHFFFGAFISMLVPDSYYRNKKEISMTVLLFVLILWEIIEITATLLEYQINLFQETNFDRTKDIVIGSIGILAIYYSKNR